MAWPFLVRDSTASNREVEESPLSIAKEAPGSKKVRFLSPGKSPEARKSTFYRQGGPRKQESPLSIARKAPGNKKVHFPVFLQS